MEILEKRDITPPEQERYMELMAEPVKFALEALLCRGFTFREVAELIDMPEGDLSEIAKNIM